MLAFSATGGVTYLIVVSGKGSGGLLKIRAGYPTITGVEYTSAPDGSDSLKITGAGFVNGNAAVTAQLDGEDVALPNMFFVGPPQPDGTDTTLFAWKKKLKKLVKRGSLVVRVESPQNRRGLHEVRTCADDEADVNRHPPIVAVGARSIGRHGRRPRALLGGACGAYMDPRCVPGGRRGARARATTCGTSG